MKYLIIGIVILSLLSCSNNSKIANTSIQTYQQRRSQYINNYFKKYEVVWKQAIDSLKTYKADSLSYVSDMLFTNQWTVDSILVFNTDSTRFYTKLLFARPEWKDAELDKVDDFGGALIDGKWYFFKMGTVTYVPRGEYHHDPYEPLTFEELSYIAWRGAIPGLIYRAEDGNIVTNHKAIDQMFFSTDKRRCPDSSRIRECKDSLYLANLYTLLRGKLSKKEILEIQEEIATSKKPYVPPYKELTWWDRLWGKEEKLFDSEAWKERYNYKKEEEIQ